MNSPRSFRTTELVKEWCIEGHDVTLITFYDPKKHDLFKEKYGLNILPLRGNIKISQGQKNIFYKTFFWILNRLFDYPNIVLMFTVKEALKDKKGYDILLSIAAPHSIHWGVAWARSRQHRIAKTWIADCGDPYMGNKVGRRKMGYFKFLEKWFCRETDHILVPLGAAKKAYYPAFEEKISVIPQGFNFRETRGLLKGYKKNNVITFSFTGNFIVNQRDPRPILDFLLAYKKPFKFIIYTKNAELVAPYRKLLKNKLEIRSYIPRDELIPILGQMDFLLNIENGVEEQKPSKLIDYALVNRPVLSINSSQMDIQKLKDFLEGNFSKRLEFTNIDQYNIKYICQKIMKLHYAEE